MVEKVIRYKNRYGNEYDTEEKALKEEFERDLIGALEKLTGNIKPKDNYHIVDNIYTISHALANKRPELAAYIIERLK